MMKCAAEVVNPHVSPDFPDNLHPTRMKLIFTRLSPDRRGGMVLLAHYDTSERANVTYKKLGPLPFSPFRGDKEHLIAVPPASFQCKTKQTRIAG
jgi:hypothetical protein